MPRSIPRPLLLLAFGRAGVSEGGEAAAADVEARVPEVVVSATRQNVGRTRTVGGDVDLAYRLEEWLTLTAGYAYADATITSFPGGASPQGKRVPNVSRHQITAALTLGTPERVQVTLTGRFLSKQFADDLNTQPIADFVVLDLSVQRQLGRWARLYLDAENLTNRQYIATQTGPIKTLGAPLLVMGGARLVY